MLSAFVPIRKTGLLAISVPTKSGIFQVWSGLYANVFLYVVSFKSKIFALIPFDWLSGNDAPPGTDVSVAVAALAGSGLGVVSGQEVGIDQESHFEKSPIERFPAPEQMEVSHEEQKVPPEENQQPEDSQVEDSSTKKGPEKPKDPPFEVEEPVSTKEKEIPTEVEQPAEEEIPTEVEQPLEEEIPTEVEQPLKEEIPTEVEQPTEVEEIPSEVGEVGGEGDPPVVTRQSQWALKPPSRRGRGGGRGRGRGGRGGKKMPEVTVVDSDQDIPQEPDPKKMRKTPPTQKKNKECNPEGPKTKRQRKSKKPGSTKEEDEEKEKEKKKDEDCKLVWEIITKENCKDFPWKPQQLAQDKNQEKEEIKTTEEKEEIKTTEDQEKEEIKTTQGNEGDVETSQQRGSFARRPCPKTTPSKEKWECIVESFETEIHPYLYQYGFTVGCWEARTTRYQPKTVLSVC